MHLMNIYHFVHESFLNIYSQKEIITLYLCFLFQPPILILQLTVIEARNLEAKDADGKPVYLFLVT